MNDIATIERPASTIPAPSVDSIAWGFGHPTRSPLLHWPDEAGLEFENLCFPSADGVPLEAWYIPCAGSTKLILANHPLTFSRAGFPAHLEPWKSMFGAGNDFDVNFIPDYKILHDAGYNVLTYDFRNFGHSGAANGGIQSAGIYEARDVLGSLAYVRSQPLLAEMTIGLFSRCLGANATIFAMQKKPEAFASVRCLVAAQPLSVRVIMERTLEMLDMGSDIDALDIAQQRITSFTLDEMSPILAARSLNLPSLVYQVRDDRLTRPSDVQSIFDAIPAAEKKLIWVEGTTRRWDGYTYFQRAPDQMLAWFATYMA